jgi:hypothetical protein
VPRRNFALGEAQIARVARASSVAQAKQPPPRDKEERAMTRIGFAALTALALWGCGGLEDEVQVGAQVDAMVATEEHPPPVVVGPQRLSTEELFKDTAPVIRGPEDRTLADKEHYIVDIPRGGDCK